MHADNIRRLSKNKRGSKYRRRKTDKKEDKKKIQFT